ncbi:MAG TPA: hypothetical protein PLQ54_17280 [Armatimonadota bacterium]|nr:hypothetical protein [Armatimonadota bacterium]
MVAGTYPRLFEPLALRSRTAPNRIVMPPMVTNMGVTSEPARAYYAERARGGVGTVIVEAVQVRLFAAEIGPALMRPLARCIQDAGSLAVVQLFVQDRVSPDADRLGPSALDGAREATVEELRALQRQLARAAVVCEEAGFDGVEIHGAHGFFLNRFFAPEWNQRTDGYGGSLENRMRMGLECVRAVMEAKGPELLVFYRHTPAWGGYGIDESIAFAAQLVAAGVDVLDISPSLGPNGEHAHYAGLTRQHTTVPVIAVNGMNDPARADAALAEGRCDLVAIGRGLLADPMWPTKVRQGREAEIVRCTECNEKCFGNLGRGEPISCVENPRVGLEWRD